MQAQLKPAANTNTILDEVAAPAKVAAQMLGVSPRTLANWRSEGKGPDYVRLGRRHSAVVYRVDDLKDWLAANVVDAKTGQPRARKTRRTKA